MKPDEKKPSPEGGDEDIDLLNLGEAYMADEPDYIGEFPKRQDLPIEPANHVSHCKTPDHPEIDFPDEKPEPIVLGPDEPREKKISFAVYEVLGYPVVRLPADLQGRVYKVGMFTPEEEERLAALAKDAYDHKLTSFDDLKVGDLVLALGMTGWNVVKIDELRPERKNGSALTPEGKTLYMLQFDNDDRHCWACIGSGNLIGLQRLHLQ